MKTLKMQVNSIQHSKLKAGVSRKISSRRLRNKFLTLQDHSYIAMKR